MKQLDVGYFCIIPTLWAKKPENTGYFVLIIETNYELPASKPLYLRAFRGSKKWMIAEKCRQFVHYLYTTPTPIFLQNR